jgi:hypothetical protein
MTLHQNKSPGADKDSTWLPAPNSPIYLVMRLYWPNHATVDPAGGRRQLEAACGHQSR